MLFPDGGTEDKEEDEMKKDDTEELYEHLRKDDGKPILDEGDEKNEEIMDEGVEEALKEAEDEAAATDATTPEPATFDSLRPPRPKRPVDEDEMPPYDEETQKLIAGRLS
ncbi:unnamed protein product [Anisakis simplex]|uniref:DUF4604 domain-containing protein n=1 Tax=Anisakis simplex TaxID=6269 RepID=A0A0M3JGN8_ANISI|nr:unnamed protein product [Anisakis simplex]